MDTTFTPENVMRITGVVLSLVFLFYPPARDWFNQLTGAVKAAIMAGGAVLIALAMLGLACAGVLPGTCALNSALDFMWKLVIYLVSVLEGSQITYLIGKRPAERFDAYRLQRKEDQA